MTPQSLFILSVVLCCGDGLLSVGDAGIGTGRPINCSSNCLLLQTTSQLQAQQSQHDQAVVTAGSATAATGAGRL